MMARYAPQRRRPRASRWCSCSGTYARRPTAASASACCASSLPPGAASSWRSTIRPTGPCSRSTRARGASSRPAGAACAPGRDREAARPRARERPRPASGAFVEHDLDDRRPPRAGRPPARDLNAASVVVGLVRNCTERYPEGMQRVALLGRPDPRARLARRAGVPADHRRARPRRGARRARRVVRPVGRREDRDGLRHREHGLDRRGAAPDHRVHPGRRRDQRRRDRHQRRRPALLERRGDDAHAHARDPRHDARRARWS